MSVSRPNFVALCHRLTAEDEQVFEHLWRMLGLSVDWSLLLRHHLRAGPSGSPSGASSAWPGAVRWSSGPPPPCGTSISARRCPRPSWRTGSVPGAYHRLRFPRVGGRRRRSTSRPPGPSCWPPVWRWWPTPTTTATAPSSAPRSSPPCSACGCRCVAHELADPDKGSGIAMVCTFGDTTDVVWWRELSLPTRTIVGRDGRLLPVELGRRGLGVGRPRGAAAAYGELAGLHGQAGPDPHRRAAAAIGRPHRRPEPITHPVKFYEKGRASPRDRLVPPVVRRDPPAPPRLLARGEELRWHPPYMAHRYRAWVEGLNGDWNISRQRFFGVPFPSGTRSTRPARRSSTVRSSPTIGQPRDDGQRFRRAGRLLEPRTEAGGENPPRSGRSGLSPSGLTWTEPLKPGRKLGDACERRIGDLIGRGTGAARRNPDRRHPQSLRGLDVSIEGSAHESRTVRAACRAAQRPWRKIAGIGFRHAEAVGIDDRGEHRRVAELLAESCRRSRTRWRRAPDGIPLHQRRRGRDGDRGRLLGLRHETIDEVVLDARIDEAEMFELPGDVLFAACAGAARCPSRSRPMGSLFGVGEGCPLRARELIDPTSANSRWKRSRHPPWPSSVPPMSKRIASTGRDASRASVPGSTDQATRGPCSCGERWLGSGGMN